LSWVSSSYDEKYNKKNIKSFGLNSFGINVVQICNDNGIIIDVSHIGEKSFWDIAKITSKPFIASHSSVYNLCNHFRNLKDNQLFAIKKSGGLVGVNPYPFFIDPTFKKREERFKKENTLEMNKIIINERNKIEQWIKKQHYLQKALQPITPSIEIFVDHVEYIVKLIGIDYVGIGSDYDGLDCLPKEISDCRDHNLIVESLDRRGYKMNQIEKIMGLNFLRVYEEVKS
jgi:membrane dipeptidase